MKISPKDEVIIVSLNMLHNRLLADAEKITNISGRDYVDDNGVHREEIIIQMVHENETLNADDLLDENRAITGWK